MSIIIGLANQKGGVGKSTITYNLAWTFAQDYNYKVRVLDCDPQGSIADSYELCDYNEKEAGTVTVERCSITNVNSVSAAGLELYDIQLIDIAGSLYDYKGDKSATTKYLYILDIALVPLEPSTLDALSTMDFINALNKVNNQRIEDNEGSIIIRAFLNKAGRERENKDVLKYLKDNNVELLGRNLNRSVDLKRIFDNQCSLLSTVPASKNVHHNWSMFVKDIIALFKDVETD